MYKSLETIPYKKFIRITETDDYYLLSKEEKDKEDFTNEELEKFKLVWDKIYKSSLEIKPAEEDERVFDIAKEIDYLQSKYKLINSCCDCLRFDWDDEIVNILKRYDFTITDSNYYDDINTIAIESESILINIEAFRIQLPIRKEKQNKNKITVDDMLASVCAVLGIDFDFNLASFTKVNGYLKQVQAKIKALETTSK